MLPMQKVLSDVEQSHGKLHSFARRCCWLRLSLMLVLLIAVAGSFLSRPTVATPDSGAEYAISYRETSITMISIEAGGKQEASPDAAAASKKAKSALPKRAPPKAQKSITVMKKTGSDVLQFVKSASPGVRGSSPLSLRNPHVPELNLTRTAALSSEWENCSASDVRAVELLVGDRLRGTYNTCALVGGSHSLMKREDGKLIDSHDAVFRVNRLPSPNYYKYAGKRTTVYFAGSVADGKSRFTKDGYVAQFINSTGQARLCRYDRSKADEESCGFKNLVMNLGTLPLDGDWKAMYPKWSPGWHPDSSEYPIGHMSNQLLNVVRLAEQTIFNLSSSQRVTSGMQSLFLIAPLCNSIDIYGMGSPGTVDAHMISLHHNMMKERNFIQRIARGYDLRPKDWSCPSEHAADCEVLSKVVCSLAAKAREGKLSLRRPPEHYHVTASESSGHAKAMPLLDGKNRADVLEKIMHIKSLVHSSQPLPRRAAD